MRNDVTASIFHDRKLRTAWKKAERHDFILSTGANHTNQQQQKSEIRSESNSSSITSSRRLCFLRRTERQIKITDFNRSGFVLRAPTSFQLFQLLCSRQMNSRNCHCLHNKSSCEQSHVYLLKKSICFYSSYLCNSSAVCYWSECELCGPVIDQVNPEKRHFPRMDSFSSLFSLSLGLIFTGKMKVRFQLKGSETVAKHQALASSEVGQFNYPGSATPRWRPPTWSSVQTHRWQDKFTVFTH